MKTARGIPTTILHSGRLPLQPEREYGGQPTPRQREIVNMQAYKGANTAPQQRDYTAIQVDNPPHTQKTSLSKHLSLCRTNLPPFFTAIIIPMTLPVPAPKICQSDRDLQEQICLTDPTTWFAEQSFPCRLFKSQ